MTRLSVRLYKERARGRVAQEQAVLVTARCRRFCEILTWLRALSFLVGAGTSARHSCRTCLLPTLPHGLPSAGFGEQKWRRELEEKKGMN